MAQVSSKLKHLFATSRRFDGIYKALFSGYDGSGLALFIVFGANISGCDTSGGMFDGTMEEVGADITIRIQVNIPDGTLLVNSSTHAGPIIFDIVTTLTEGHILNEEIFTVEIPGGAMNVRFIRLKELSSVV